MFKFLKQKLKQAVDKMAKVSDKDVIEEPADTAEIAQAQQKEKEIRATELPDTTEAQEHRAREKKPSLDMTPEGRAQETQKTRVRSHKEKERKEPVSQEKKKPARTEEKKTRSEQNDAPQPETKKSFFKKVFGKQQETPEESSGTTTPETNAAVTASETKTREPEKKSSEESKSILDKLSENFKKKRLTEEKFEELFWELELSLLENNVAVEVIEKIKNDMKQDLTTGTVTRKGIQQLIVDSLRESIEELFVEPFNLVHAVTRSKKRPFIIAVIGVNGSGKTTTLAKLANLFQENDLRVVLAASDTFRAAAIDQLKEHADKLSIKLISQGYHADPAAVAFDAIKHAEAQNIDVVLIDTAGRLHSNTNLMAELEKVVRVSKPDLKIFVGESITGNDCVEQAEEFNKAVGIDAIILSKADVDEKGGAAISVSYVTGKPIIYLGVGQAYGDLRPFDSERIVKSLGLTA